MLRSIVNNNIPPFSGNSSGGRFNLSVGASANKFPVTDPTEEGTGSGGKSIEKGTGSGTGTSGGLGIAQNTCHIQLPFNWSDPLDYYAGVELAPKSPLVGPANYATALPAGIRCCATTFFTAPHNRVAACDTSSCPNNFGTANRNCFNYGSPQHPVDAYNSSDLSAASRQGGSAICPYTKADRAICDTSYYIRLNTALGLQQPNCRRIRGVNHCLGKVRCQTEGVYMPREQGNPHSNGTSRSGLTPAGLIGDCPNSVGEAGADCFYDGNSENWKVCESQPATPSCFDGLKNQGETTPDCGGPCPECGSTFGDPHFHGFDGSTYDFQGMPGHVFNIISDSTLQVNAKFVESPVDHRTFMGRFGIRIGGDHIFMDANTQEVRVNGFPVAEDESVELVSDLAKGIVTHFHHHVMITLGGYRFGIFRRKHTGGYHLDLTSEINSFSNPHGILGQTAQYLTKGEEAQPQRLRAKKDGKKENSDGFLEGKAEDYLVADGLFGSEFTFNRFGKKASTFEGAFVKGGAHFERE